MWKGQRRTRRQEVGWFLWLITTWPGQQGPVWSLLLPHHPQAGPLAPRAPCFSHPGLHPGPGTIQVPKQCETLTCWGFCLCGDFWLPGSSLSLHLTQVIIWRPLSCVFTCFNIWFHIGYQLHEGGNYLYFLVFPGPHSALGILSTREILGELIK